jgi:hypothetical protein
VELAEQAVPDGPADPVVPVELVAQAEPDGLVVLAGSEDRVVSEVIS